MNNIYLPPTPSSLPPLPRFHWLRVIVWAILIFMTINVLAFIAGLTMSNWGMYGHTMEEAVDNVRLVRRICIGAACAVLYWRFVAGVSSKPLLHVAALFVLLRLIDMSLSFFVFSDPIDELFNILAIGRAFAAAVGGLVLAWIFSKQVFAS